MSQLLRTKIERKFHQIAVIDCIAKADLADYLAGRGDVELVISTVSLEELKIPMLLYHRSWSQVMRGSWAFLWISLMNHPAVSKKHFRC